MTFKKGYSFKKGNVYGFKKGQKAWNKGLTKADSRVLKYANKKKGKKLYWQKTDFHNLS